ncbi:MAG: hypothetical protein QF662_07860 [Phycisphaerae bacterium]|nr:hypothetical protein [Phycisphaerae bacterium]
MPVVREPEGAQAILAFCDRWLEEQRRVVERGVRHMREVELCRLQISAAAARAGTVNPLQ